MLVLFGGASGQVPPIDPQELNRRGGLFVTRPAVHWYLQNAQERAWRFSELFSSLTSGDLRLNIGGTYPLTEAGRAHDDLEAAAPRASCCWCRSGDSPSCPPD